jgi:hypothetical protein
VNASEFFVAVTGLPGARAVVVEANGVAESRFIAGVEIARATSPDERALRRAWRDRSRGGPDPLLLVADDPDREGTFRALGPLGAGGPVRVVAADDLLRLVERLPALPRLQAVRTLAEELDQLDRTGVAGLVVRGLGTEYLLTQRLPTGPRWPRLSELAEGVAGEWREILTGLGYELEALPSRGYLARAAGKPVAVVWPVADPSAFAKLDAEGRPPEGLVINECLRAGAPYGLLASGSRFRLLEARPVSGSSVGRYLELDAAALPEEHRPLLALLSPEWLGEGEFEALMREARDSGAKLRERIDQAIRQAVLPSLGLELGRWATTSGWDLADDKRRGELEAAALTFVFRALFLLYAESAGHLPVSQEAYRPHSFKQIVQDATAEELDPRATALWRGVQLLVEAMRTGNTAWAVPGYNGDLFAPDGFEGAEVLDQASIPDSALGPALAALGIDPDTGAGFDFSGLEIGHLGHIYEGLLSLRLSVADSDYRYDSRADRYVAAEPDEREIERGELLWLTDEGGRKGGGVYYTHEALVRHLVRRGVVPPFERHLEDVAGIAREDPVAAAKKLFEFRVLDPACGSAHFLVAVVDELADLVARFLAQTPLPAVRRELDDLRAGAGETYGVGVEDVALLRRLVLRRCVYGVDISPMGAEIAKISLWLASFVPGLSLSYLDHNVRVGNSLIGVASAEQLVDAQGGTTIPAMLVMDAMAAAAEAAHALQALMDRNPDEVAQSEELDREARETAGHTRALLDLWVAEPLGLSGARAELWSAAEGIGRGDYPAIVDPAREVAARYRAFHWPLEFAEAFADRGGFDAVVGNPPWEEVTVEELAFYARYEPGLRSLPEAERSRELKRLKRERPELADRLAEERERVATFKRFFSADTDYVGSGADPDLYNFFCQRYRRLLARDGSLAVVLPRSAFSTRGSAGFRRWLFEGSTVRRLDFLLNRRRWMFDTHPQYTVALAVARASAPPDGHRIEVAGVADSEAEFIVQSQEDGLILNEIAFGLGLEVPLLPSQPAASLLQKLRESGTLFPRGGGRWLCFPTREFDETDDKKLWEGATDGLPLWKGESFDQYHPHGAEARFCPLTDKARARAKRSRAGSESILAAEVPLKDRVAAHLAEAVRSRVGFRDVTNRTNSRTVVAALIPAGTLLVNSVRYLVFLNDRDLDRACCLGLLNSLAFDWQARRFVETHLNYFILEGLRVPTLSDEAFAAVARAAARLSCPDERFADFAEAADVESGPLNAEERDELRAEIDALVAHAYGLNEDELELVFSDFTLDAVPEDYRQLVRHRFADAAA